MGISVCSATLLVLAVLTVACFAVVCKAEILKSSFLPRRIWQCAAPGPDGRIVSGPGEAESPSDFGADRGGDTVANNSPFSETVTGMNIAATRGGPTPSSVPEDGPINPIMRAGLASRVWRWSNPLLTARTGSGAWPGSPCGFAPELYLEPVE